MVYEYSATALSMHWRVIDVSTGEVRPEGDVDLGGFGYTSVASPDGSTVAVAGETGEIVTIDVSTGREQRRSTSLGAEVLWLNYSDDGELLVSGADDGGVSLWDASTLDLLGTVYPPHRGEPVPAGAQFIGDSHDVAIASYDGKVYRWETDVERAIDFACQMAGRNLTEEEWAGVPARPALPRGLPRALAGHPETDRRRGPARAADPTAFQACVFLRGRCAGYWGRDCDLQCPGRALCVG